MRNVEITTIYKMLKSY